MSYQHTNIPTYQHTNIPTYQHTNIPTCQHTNIPTYQHTNIPTYQHTNIPTYQHILSNVLSYCILISIIYLIVLAHKLYNQLIKLNGVNSNIELFNSNSKQIYNEINRIKAKSYDLADNNILLRRNSEELKNELQKLKHKQFINCNDINLLRSQSFSSKSSSRSSSPIQSFDALCHSDLKRSIDNIQYNQSFDSTNSDYIYHNDTKINKLENEINILKHKQYQYQKDTILFKHLVNDIQRLKTKYDELSTS